MPEAANIVWLNGEMIPREEAKISPFDRGFTFGDAVYEVTAVYNGRPVDLDAHMARLSRSLKGLDFETLPDLSAIEAMHHHLIAANNFDEGGIYLQVSRGFTLGRDFLPSAGMSPTVFGAAIPMDIVDTPIARNGKSVITLEDVRWMRRDIKTTQLLAQSMAQRAARQRDATDAWMVDPEGYVTEASSANAWIVTHDGELITRNLSTSILAGVTRATVMTQLPGSVRLVERAFTVDEALGAAEAFNTSASTLVAPVISIDGRQIADGMPGPVTREIQRSYLQNMGVDIAQRAQFVLF